MIGVVRDGRLGNAQHDFEDLALGVARIEKSLHGGVIEARSAPGQGARFTLSVPAAEDLREKPR